VRNGRFLDRRAPFGDRFFLLDVVVDLKVGQPVRRRPGVVQSGDAGGEERARFNRTIVFYKERARARVCVFDRCLSCVFEPLKWRRIFRKSRYKYARYIYIRTSDDELLRKEVRFRTVVVVVVVSNGSTASAKKTSGAVGGIARVFFSFPGES